MTDFSDHIFYPATYLKTPDSILRAIAYFDVFNYPVKIDEVFRFMNSSATVEEVSETLEMLADQKIIFKLDNFYSLQDDLLLAVRRKEGNQKAEAMLQTAYRIGNLLHSFPYVTGVGISGSLSKDFADANADIDFFIITKANRLWIARTLLHCLKKLSFLLGRQHWYCMNYFVDEEALLIAEENIFTAMEVVTLKPVCNSESIKDFFIANEWVGAYFPNRRIDEERVIRSKKSWFKTAGEKIFNNRFGNWIDNRLMQVTAKRWQQKEKQHKLNSKGDPVGLAIDKHFARPNPGNLQKKILSQYQKRVSALTTLSL